MSSLGIAALVLATVWLFLRRRHEQRRMPEILEKVSGRAVLLFSRTGELRALGPRARAVLGFEGRVDPITIEDLPLEGLDGWILGLCAPVLGSGVRPGPILFHRGDGRVLRVDAELVPVRPRRGDLPAWVSLAMDAEIVPGSKPPPVDVRAPQAQAHDAKRGRLAAARVLLAEDSPDNQRLVTHLLEREGAVVTLAANGAEAIEHARAATFDVVLLDMEMPVVTGWEAAATLREIVTPAPIVALTGHDSPGDAERCREAGCSHFLAKPIKRARLIDLVSELVGRALAAAPAQQAAPRQEPPSIEESLEDDPEYQALIAEFVGDLATRIDEMQNAVESEDWESLEALAHKLKGAAGGFGLPEITEVSAELEQSARKQDTAASAVFDRLSQLVTAARG